MMWGIKKQFIPKICNAIVNFWQKYAILLRILVNNIGYCAINIK